MLRPLRCLPRCNLVRRRATHYCAAGIAICQTRGIVSAATTTHRHVHRSVLRQVHPRHLYQIINDVDQYQHFLPYCQESRILQRSPDGTMYDAVLRVGLPGLSNLPVPEERYVSRVRMLPADDGRPEWTVEAKSIQSQLFDSLSSRWELSLADGANGEEADEQATEAASCQVNFEVELRVSNPLISLTLDQVLKDVARAQVDAHIRVH
ncbi:hypothetical protein ACHAXT_007917 [Thalassiosira profunda]